MPLDKDFARKHKFWVVLAGALGLILIAIVFLMVIVPGSIGKERDTVKSEWDKITNALKGEVRNPKHVTVAQEKADKEKGKQKGVHQQAWEAQKKLFNWPREMEAKYDFSHGLFALEVAILGKDPKLDEQLKDEKTAEGKERFHGKIQEVDAAGEWITVEGRDPKQPAKKLVLTFWQLPSTKVSEGEAKDQEFKDLQGKTDFLVAVTFERGRYFGDPLTDREQELFKQEYKKQLWGILDEAQPLNEKGEIQVMFKDYVWPYRLKDKETRRMKWLPPPPALLGAEALEGGAGGPLGLPAMPPGGIGGVGGVGGLAGANRFFRYVKEWEERERKDISEEAWLAQEDLWVQRELFRLVKKANDYVADFAPVPGQEKDKFRFHNPYWRMDLTVLGDNKVHVKITNLLDRPQRVDVEFRVRYTPTGRLIPMPRFNQEPLHPRGSAKESLEQTFTVEDEGVPVGKVEKIHAVRQVLTWETAAVKRIDQVAIGTAVADQWAFSHLDALRKPIPIKELPADKAPEPVADDKGIDPMGMGKGGLPGGIGGTQLVGTLPSLTLNKLVRNRYRAVTPQARRIPVGIALIVDQLHVTRVQTAFTDSPLRFRTSQVLLHRYPRTVRPDSSSYPGGDIYAGGSGAYPGAEGYPGSGGYPRMPANRMSQGYGGSGMYGGFGTGLPQYSRPGSYPMDPGLGPDDGTSEDDPTYDPRRSGGEEIESNMELVIYGVVSIYERFPPRGYTLQGAEPAAKP
ncbi:MAG: hypothetical protein L0Z62_35580 [Gemmataceae bacterium]|nr:hypothetical protein [Gemmataceae bacterium]